MVECYRYVPLHVFLIHYAYPSMRTDIEMLLTARLLCLRNCVSSEILRKEVTETRNLIDLVTKEKVVVRKSKGFLIFQNSNNSITNILKIVAMKRVASLPPITRRGKENLYQYRGNESELISRGFSTEEHQRIEYLGAGFYYISDRINNRSDQLFYVSKNLIPGYLKYHKLTTNGEVKEFRQRKNNGKIFQIVIPESILESERQEKQRRFGSNSRFRNRIIQGDCLRLMKEIESQSVDLIIADLPYGKFRKCHWDCKIDLEEFWQEIERIAKPRAAILLFGKEPFSSTLRMSNQSLFKYDITWIKNNASNFVQGNRMPLNFTETISVFYDRLLVYNPQKTSNPNGAVKAAKKQGSRRSFNELDAHLEKTLSRYETSSSLRYEPDKLLPKNYLFYSVERRDRLHPTQKPLELLKYLIKTFSNPGDLVFDPTVGSGTTCVAAKQLERDYIGFEKLSRYVEISNQRLSDSVR